MKRFYAELKSRKGITGEERLPSPSSTLFTRRIQLVSIITAIITITICSKSSPIYPLNDWVDSNCFFTVGKSMLKGLVPYRDLYEQKGPLLYMLHAVAALFSKNSFIGMYFFEIIAAAVFLFFSFKTMQLYLKRVDTTAIPLFAALIYSSDCFCHGDSAEEFCLPIFAFSIYLIARLFKTEQLPSLKEFLIVGVTSGAILWIKFSMLGLYLGWFCVIAVWLIKEKDIKYLFRAVGYIGIGVLIISVPILLYFTINRSLSDLYTVYFYNNLFHYSQGESSSGIISLFNNLYIGISKSVYYNFLPMIFIFIGMIRLIIKKKYNEFLSYFTMLLTTFILVYIAGRSYRYYPLIFCSFSPLGFLSVYKAIRSFISLFPRKIKKFRIIRIIATVLVCSVSVLYMFTTSSNTYLLKYSRSDMPQYRFAEIINRDENATLLNYDVLDLGVYTTTGIVPNCKYFVNLNIDLKEIMDTQNEFVRQGKVDYIVTRDKPLTVDNYKCIATDKFYFEGVERTYRLYKLYEK